MQPSRIRKKLQNDEVIFCAKASYGNPEITELFSSADFDGIWICLEHKRCDPTAIYSQIQACRLGGADAILRVNPSNDTDLLWLLEGGTRGIMLPRSRGVEEVKRVIEMMKFPPLGRRGLDGVGTEANFGRMPVLEYVAEANRENFLMVQIEEPEAVPHIDAIAALPGVDILFVGPGDLTLSLGKFGKFDDPEVVAILRQVAESARRHDKVAGIPCAADRVSQYYDMGFRFFNVVSDFRCVASGLEKTKADLKAAGFALKPNT